MKHLLPTILFSAVLLSGCANYAYIEQARMGMTYEEFSYLDTPCDYRGQTDKNVFYTCKFKMPTGLIRPYVMTFTDGKLTEIMLDENEMNRQIMRDRIYYQHHFYHHPGFGYYYGYPHPFYYP
jgi:hypothetical protein